MTKTNEQLAAENAVLVQALALYSQPAMFADNLTPQTQAALRVLEVVGKYYLDALATTDSIIDAYITYRTAMAAPESGGEE